MKLALVTGAGGFLGGAIAQQLLERGVRVRSLARGHYPHLSERGIECCSGDLRDAAAVRRACDGVDTVFHVAAKAGIWGAWSDYFQINVEGTRNVLRACQQLQIPRLIYTSSPSVTFAATDQCGIDESASYPRRWLCHYSHTKALAEQEVLQASGERGVATCALRPHLIWGPGDAHLIPRLLARARQGRLRRIGGGQNRIDVTYVTNAADIHLAAAERLAIGSPPAGRAYFVSQGEPVNCWGWINQVLALAGLPPVRRGVPLRVAWLAGAVLERVYRAAQLRGEPPMTRFLAAQLATSHYFDIGAARRDLGYQPRISLTEGLQRLAEWLRVDRAPGDRSDGAARH